MLGYLGAISWGLGPVPPLANVMKAMAKLINGYTHSRWLQSRKDTAKKNTRAPE